MPINKVPRFKVVKCRTCGRTIGRFDRTKYLRHHVPVEAIMVKTRRHYKKYHPEKFKESIRKGVKARARKK